MATFEIAGVLPVIPTPFARDGGLDLAAFDGLLEFAISARVCGVILPAYASEFYKLRDAERRELVLQAIRILNGRLPVVAQINHFSAAHVAETARDLERAGAAAISVAVPRAFGLPERDLLRYFDRILQAITVPLVIQDFNPGGTTVSVEFVKSLNGQHAHFQYLKLEEPLMSGKVRSILDETHGAVGVIDGWGGTYMLELIDAGICGVMPGLAVSDLLQIIWENARAGKKDVAYELFQGVLPQITFSLQNLEFFHHAEKALLVARGVLSHAEVRDATLTIHEIERAHIDFLNRKVIDLVSRQTMDVHTAVHPQRS
ncbi:MAG: dihydrodipicolinate synthase family protein [Candidatus Sulfotelmatobacter sp.]